MQLVILSNIWKLGVKCANETLNLVLMQHTYDRNDRQTITKRILLEFYL